MQKLEDIYRARLQLLIKEAGSQAKLSEKVGKSPAQISQWLNASKDSKTGKPRSMDRKTAAHFEQKCAKPEGWMNQPFIVLDEAHRADGPTKHLPPLASNPSIALTAIPQHQMARTADSNVESRPVVSGNVPLISWIRAGDFCESPDNFAPGDADEYLPRPLQNMGRHVFALTVRGDSMDTADGYREGEIVYIDPDKSPVSGQDVVARVNDKLNLKRYKEDQDGPYLLQLNGNIIIRPKGEWSICGVVVFSGKRR
ncbi:S24 family peptidase [Polaromonas sp.]|uniref:S24 family peptidase n=1 Tax=Polaromonas sp. TaxID=1869339 RepID=UPI003750B8DC